MANHVAHSQSVVKKRESRESYMARLRRTAVRLPPAVISRSIVDMRRRCEKLLEAKGDHFEEGGNRSRRPRASNACPRGPSRAHCAIAVRPQ